MVKIRSLQRYVELFKVSIDHGQTVYYIILIEGGLI